MWQYTQECWVLFGQKGWFHTDEYELVCFFLVSSRNLYLFLDLGVTEGKKFHIKDKASAEEMFKGGVRKCWDHKRNN